MSKRPQAMRAPSSGIPRSGSSMLPPAIKPPSRAPSPTESHSGGVGAKKVVNGEINIQVVVRCRGRSALEKQQASPIITQTSGPLSKAITIETAPPAVAPGLSYSAHSHLSRTYGFDRVFGPEADQNMVYKEVVEGMLDEVLAGYNCTIFAYGQTGTGKTYTMQGDVSLTPLSTPTSDAGIIPRVLHRLFSLLDARPSSDYTVKCSYMEIYNEELRDLLAADYNSSRAATPLLLRDDSAKKGGGVVVQGLEEIGVKSTKEALALLTKGSTRRQTAETKMNSESSRSHSIFSLTVHVREAALRQGSEELLRIGKLNLVDLAGSEAISKSGAENQRAKEANSINKSLLMLGRVISALVEKASHIPYRDSKLTRILQDSLGGRTKTCIVATVSPTRSNLEETLSTLDYASRAKTIRNKPQINQHLTKSGVLKDYLGEIERLKADLLATRDKSGVFVAAESWESMHAEHENRRSQLEDARQRADAVDLQLGTIKAEFETNMTTLLAREADLVEARKEAEELQGMVRHVRDELDIVKDKLEEEQVVSEAFMAGEERLDRVAGGLRSVATESVKDVGGLFAKLARKAAVLGSNTTTANEFAGGLHSLSADLKRGLQNIRGVQTEFGQVLRSEVQTFADEGKQLSRDGIASLTDTFSIFEENVKKLQISLDTASADSEASSAAITRLADGLRDACVEWATGVEQRSKAFAKDASLELEEQSKMITDVLNSTTDLVDAVIATAQGHVESQADATARMHQLAQQASQAEISRLRTQNELLIRLLNDERVKTVRMRTELVSNVQNMLVAFTDAQDRSLRESLSEIQVANVEAETGLGEFERAHADEVDRSQERTADIKRELEAGAESAAKHKVAGVQATTDAQAALSRHIDDFAHTTAQCAANFQQTSRESHQQLAESSTAAYQRATAAFDGQKQALSKASSAMQESQIASQERFKYSERAIHDMSSTVLASHATSTTKLDEQHAACLTRVATLDSATSAFLAAGILEDVATGSTPRKRAFNVPEGWERTKPRELLVENFRRRKAGLEGESEPVPSALSTSASTVSTVISEETPPSSAVDLASFEDQQNIPPIAPLGKSISKKGVVRRPAKEDRPNLTILGEGMAANVPLRRSRKV